jgi:hypothetical protein
MHLLPGKVAAARVSGILHAKYQVHAFYVNLTASKISALDPIGQVDFGGNEYIAAGHIEMAAQSLRLGDRYQWWNLASGSYFVECNEILNLAEDEIALIEPDDRLLRAGASHVTQFVRGHVAPVELLLEVKATCLRIKENARISRVRLFRLDVAKILPASLRKPSARSRKTTRLKKETTRA